MLDLYYRLVRRLYRIRPILWVLGALAVAAFGGLLFLSGGSIDGSYALVSLAILLWALWLLAVAHSLTEPVAEVDPTARAWTRFKARFERGLAWVQALTMMALFILAVVITVRTIGIVIDG